MDTAVDRGGRAIHSYLCKRVKGRGLVKRWYALNGADSAFTYGGDYQGTSKDFGAADQFQQQENCVSPAGPFPQYCSTLLR